MPYPGGQDSYITPSVLHRIFAHDVSEKTAAVMAATQRPFDLGILEELSGPPAWQSIPSWYLVATEDRAIRQRLSGSWHSEPARPSPKSGRPTFP